MRWLVLIILMIGTIGGTLSRWLISRLLEKKLTLLGDPIQEAKQVKHLFILTGLMIGLPVLVFLVYIISIILMILINGLFNVSSFQSFLIWTGYLCLYRFIDGYINVRWMNPHIPTPDEGIDVVIETVEYTVKEETENSN